MTKKIILANPRGFCAGVDRAITIVEETLKLYGCPVYVYHEVVHNKFVVNNLMNKGAIFVHDIAQVPDGAILIYSAHGVSLELRAQADTKNLQLILDATCPLVSKVHVEVKNLYKKGYTILMIGHKGHPEVHGTMGQVPDRIYLIESIEDAKVLQLNHDIKQIAVITQTTLSVDDTAQLITDLKILFPNLQTAKDEDICYATSNRQNAVKMLLDYCDGVIVIGSKNSSNSNRLKELVIKHGKKAYLIDSATEINDDMVSSLNNIGITAGASAPEILVQDVVQKLQQFGFCDQQEINYVDEKIIFALPKVLRTRLV
jgi:4-hydroxy-3-methylbut-2-enyl diphosphate reductase